METLLLTGGTGFVGRTLILRAFAAGTRIFAPVRSVEKLHAQLDAEGLPRNAVTPLSTDPTTWNGVHPTHAVLSAGVLFARNREEYFGTNVDWNLRALRALPDSCKTVVLSSQSAGGPTPSGQKERTETDADAPVTWYGESKLELERSISREFPKQPLTILRPPMILGARDTAALPLFKMARSLIRSKPGLREKWFSFLGVTDVVNAIFAAFELDSRGPFYIASETPISDRELIAAAARAVGARGITLPVPSPLVRLFAMMVDAAPAMRTAMPSLTRDRVREIWPNRWVVDAAAFRRATNWSAQVSLDEALHGACSHFRSCGQL